MPDKRPKLAVWKFASCDGCQLSILDCEDDLLSIAGAVDIAYFPEATRRVIRGPYDVSLVEGSVTTPDDVARIRKIRKQSHRLITIGACATSGGIQALRNFREVEDYIALVYASPSFIDTLRTSTAISDHVSVDFELRGCPVNKQQLLEVLLALLHGRKPNIRGHSVCIECKAAGISCLLVARGVPCLGPITHHAGCGALCPSYSRGCFGCFGPSEAPNTAALAQELLAGGTKRPELVRLLRSFNASAPAFKRESESHER